MNLEEFLESSCMALGKEDIGKIIGTSSSAYRDLNDLAFSRKMPACWRAAWMLDYLAEVDPDLPVQHIPAFWREMQKDHPEGVKRSILRMLCRYDIPEDYEGIATDLCLDWVQKEATPVALKAMSMDILLKVARNYPELSGEFIQVIENQLPYGTGGYVARARKVIPELEKLQS